MGTFVDGRNVLTEISHEDLNVLLGGDTTGGHYHNTDVVNAMLVAGASDANAKVIAFLGL